MGSLCRGQYDKSEKDCSYKDLELQRPNAGVEIVIGGHKSCLKNGSTKHKKFRAKTMKDHNDKIFKINRFIDGR